MIVRDPQVASPRTGTLFLRLAILRSRVLRLVPGFRPSRRLEHQTDYGVATAVLEDGCSHPIKFD